MIATEPDGYVLAHRNGATRTVRSWGGLQAALANNSERRIVGFWRVWLNEPGRRG